MDVLYPDALPWLDHHFLHPSIRHLFFVSERGTAAQVQFDDHFSLDHYKDLPGAVELLYKSVLRQQTSCCCFLLLQRPLQSMLVVACLVLWVLASLGDIWLKQFATLRWNCFLLLLTLQS